MPEIVLAHSIEPIFLPTQDDLPYDDGIPMETQRHKWQMDLLIDGLSTWLDAREDGYVNGNMFVYFNLAQAKNQDFKGPDFFAVVGVPKQERKSWVVWEEGKAPDVVIELLSPSTAQHDKTEKKKIYQDKLRVSEYFWYDPFDAEDFAGFVLHNGCYESIPLTEQGWLRSDRLSLVLRRWSGDYRGIKATWLRWATPAGVVLPTAQELAAAAQQEALAAKELAVVAQQEVAFAQQEVTVTQQRAERLAAKLRELGIDPEQV
ncbi:Uma2 family endonuclease [bacterium]|nr:Uma2 family endonuclease [bacterium]